MNVSPTEKKVVLELLSTCNLNCQHCFYRASDKYHSLDFLSLDLAKKLIDQFKANGISKLLLTGGEPTLHPQFTEIADYALNKVPKVSVCTNGVLTDKSEQELLERDFSRYTLSVDSHISTIHDGFRRRKGALEKTINFMNKLKKANKLIAVHITLNPSNTETIEETVCFCRDYTDDIVVGTMYYDKLSINDSKLVAYIRKCEEFRKKHENDKNLVIAGFEKHCNNKECSDGKDIFTVNRKGEFVECYWKANGGEKYPEEKDLMHFNLI